MTRMNDRPVGVIAGTGVAEHFEVASPKSVKTEYGVAAVYPSRDGRYFLLPRHGLKHNVPPHMVNYRANMTCIHKLGIRSVIATSAVGSMNPKFPPGSAGLIEQFIDFTRQRPKTFFDDRVVHTDMTNPYSPRLNRAVVKAAARMGMKIHGGLVYVCVEGPRFETAAEISMFRKLGGDVIGMTGVPEVVLADELGMEYASVAIATNWAAGLQRKVTHEEVVGMMKKVGAEVKELLETAINALGSKQART